MVRFAVDIVHGYKRKGIVNPCKYPPTKPFQDSISEMFLFSNYSGWRDTVTTYQSSTSSKHPEFPDKSVRDEYITEPLC